MDRETLDQDTERLGLALIGLLEHDVRAADPGGPRRQVLRAGEPERQPGRPHQDQPRRRIAGLAAAVGQVFAVVGEGALSFGHRSALGRPQGAPRPSAALSG